MKKLKLLLILLGIFFISCDKEISSETFEFGLDKEFQTNKEYCSSDNSLKFTITDINDSRCPSDVLCIWQGAAIVKIKIESPQTDLITLSTYDNLIDTIGSYSFELIDVSPYPVSTEQIELQDYLVTLNIKELHN